MPAIYIKYFNTLSANLSNKNQRKIYNLFFIYKIPKKSAKNNSLHDNQENFVFFKKWQKINKILIKNSIFLIFFAFFYFVEILK